MYDKEVNGIYCTNCNPNIFHVYDATNPAQKILEGLKKKKPSRGISILQVKETSSSPPHQCQSKRSKAGRCTPPLVRRAGRGGLTESIRLAIITRDLVGQSPEGKARSMPVCCVFDVSFPQTDQLCLKCPVLANKLLRDHYLTEQLMDLTIRQTSLW